MKLGLLHSLFFLVLLTACQVKEKSGSGLISGHVPSSNNFTVNNPVAKTYIAGENLDIVLSFPWDVTVTGTPQLSLTIGATARFANYTSGTGTKTLTFRYPIVMADNDNNGITVNSLGLNGGTLQFDQNGVMTNCNIASVTTRTFSNVLVDNANASITTFALTTVPGYYRLGNQITFLATFDEPVIVTGTPQVSVNLGSGPVLANYTGGTGTSSLAFSFTIGASNIDENGYTITNSIQLNGGTIRDAVNNNAGLTFNATSANTASSNVRINGDVPYIVSVLPPADGTYPSATALDFKIEFNREVTVSNTPYLPLRIGSNTRRANYLSGTGTKILTFQYVTVPGDSDTDGIEIVPTAPGLPPSITQDTGNILGAAPGTTTSYFNPLNNFFTTPSLANIRINSIQPQPISVTRALDTTIPVWGSAAPDNIWNIGQELLITVGFNTPMYVTQTGGAPRLPITIGATVKNAAYYSGGDGQTALVFRYVIEEGDLDNDGSIGVGNLDIPVGSTIVDSTNTNTLTALPVASITSTTIDGVRPTVASVTAPANNTYSSYRPNMDFIVNWSEPVNATAINLNFTAYATNATFSAATITTGNQTAAVTVRHAHSTIENLEDLDGITLANNGISAATVTDQVGNAANVFTIGTLPNTAGVLLDTKAPSIEGPIVGPADGTYVFGEQLNFSVTFDESVTIAAAYPAINTRIGGVNRSAAAFAAGTGLTHTFRYTIGAGLQDDVDGIEITATAMTNLTSVRDAGLNPAVSTVPIITYPNVFVNSMRPAVQASSTVPSNGIYVVSGTGPLSTLSFSLVFDKIVNVTGVPQVPITLNVGGTVYADYVSGTGTNTLLFEYDILAANLDLNGIGRGANLNFPGGASIRDTIGTGNTADPSLAAVVLTNNSNGIIIAPNISVWKRAGSNTNLSGMTSGPALSGGGAFNGTHDEYDGVSDSLVVGSATTIDSACMSTYIESFAPTQNLLNNLITITDNTSDYTLSGAGSFSGGPVVALPFNTNHKFCYVQSTTLGAGSELVNSNYGSRVGDIILGNGLSAAQRTHILSILAP